MCDLENAVSYDVCFIRVRSVLHDGRSGMLERTIIDWPLSMQLFCINPLYAKQQSTLVSAISSVGMSM